jgi:hypothetical protein
VRGATASGLTLRKVFGRSLDDAWDVGAISLRILR